MIVRVIKWVFSHFQNLALRECDWRQISAQQLSFAIFGEAHDVPDLFGKSNWLVTNENRRSQPDQVIVPEWGLDQVVCYRSIKVVSQKGYWLRNLLGGDLTTCEQNCHFSEYFLAVNHDELRVSSICGKMQDFE